MKFNRLIASLVLLASSSFAIAGPVEDFAAKNNYRVLLSWDSVLTGWKGYLSNGAAGPKILYLSPDGHALVYGVISDPKTGREVTTEDVRLHQADIQRAMSGGQPQVMAPAAVQPQQVTSSENLKPASPDTYDLTKWPALEKTVSYVRDGKVGAKEVAYIFFDPKCPHCHNFYRTVRSVNVSKEIRWIPVGILSPQSKFLAAAVLADNRGGKAMDELMTDRMLPAPTLSNEAKAKIDANINALRVMGVSGVPTTIYRQKGQLLFESGNISQADATRVFN